MRVALLTGGTATQNLQFDTVHKERDFQNFSELDAWFAGTRWKSSNARRGASKSRSRAACYEFAVSMGIPEMTPVVCQIDNAMFNSYLPGEMMFDRGLLGGRIADGKRECNFVWELRKQPDPPSKARRYSTTPESLTRITRRIQ